MPRGGRMEFWESVKSGEWFFHHKATNGQTDEPSQPYSLRRTCRRAANKAADRRGGIPVVLISDPNQ